MANGEILKEIKAALIEKTLDPDLAMRLMLTSMAGLLEKVDVDHKKTERMWPVYNGVVWMFGILCVSVIGLIWSLITGATVLTIVK